MFKLDLASVLQNILVYGHQLIKLEKYLIKYAQEDQLDHQSGVELLQVGDCTKAEGAEGRPALLVVAS